MLTFHHIGSHKGKEELEGTEVDRRHYYGNALADALADEAAEQSEIDPFRRHTAARPRHQGRLSTAKAARSGRSHLEERGAQ